MDTKGEMMQDACIFRFGPFRLDIGDERLWREAKPLRLTAKAFAVLRYLVEHAGQLVTKVTCLRLCGPRPMAVKHP
ncbi:MAG: hypothetical protein OEU26_15405 [Candidatus Tectomicrobia bacterium]|nr:hypothetical protein [Candidatus Tectomicrobia bacterium]